MSNLSKGINKLRFYFTLGDNKIKCDFCSDSYDMILNTEKVINHLSRHEQYKNDLSSESSQNDMEKYYVINDNKIKCLFCKEKLCDPWNTCSIVHFHLEEGHALNENEFRVWIDENYTSDESDDKVQKCKKCENVIIENRPIFLTKHLRDVHNDAGSDCISESIHPTFLANFFKHWVWNFFAKDGENAKCRMCLKEKNMQCLKKESYKDIEDHIKSMHQNEGLNPKKRYYTEIQEHLVKCDFCVKEFYVEYFINDRLSCHLEDTHRKNYNKSDLDTLSKYLSDNFEKLGFQKSKCNKCKKVLEKMCSINLVDHLNSHGVSIPRKIRSICEDGKSSKSESFLRSDENIENILTSSGDPKAGSSKDSDTEVRDVDHDRDSRKDLKSIQPNYLDNFFEHWVWNFLTKDEENAKCRLCLKKKNMQCSKKESYKDIEDHIKLKHQNMDLDPKKRHYTEIQEHLVKCNICDKHFPIEYIINDRLIYHLYNSHRKDYNKSDIDTLIKYLSDYFEKLGFQKSKCKECKKVLEKMCSINLVDHLNSHGVSIPRKIRSICKCKKSSKSVSLLRSDENIENIPTSSGDPKAGSSKDSDTEVRDVDHDRGSRKDLKSIQPNYLDNFFEHWVWNFFAKDEENANCRMCLKKKNMQCLKQESYKDIEDHIKLNHQNMDLDPKKRHYTEIQEHLVKCNNCDKQFSIEYIIDDRLSYHLYDSHQKDYNKSDIDTLIKYLSHYFEKLGFQKSKCKKCKKVLEKMCSINLVDHLNSHGIPIPPNIKSICECGNSTKSESLLRSDENIEIIPTSSGDPKAGSSKDSDTEVRDVDHDRDSRKDLKRKSSDRLDQPGSSKSFDIDVDDLDSGMKKVKYDDDKCSPD